MSQYNSNQNAYIEQVRQLSQSYKLGLQGDEGFEPCALSLSPYYLSETLWQNALDTSRALGKLFDQVAKNAPWLKQALATLVNAFPQANSEPLLQTQFLSALEKLDSNQRRAQHVNIIRNDLLLDKQHHWKLVESNNIAAGMGPFSEALLALHRQLFKAQGNGDQSDATPIKYVDNPATKTQSQALFDAAKDISGDTTPHIVFLVDEQEDNQFDQAYLSEALTALGAKVSYCSLATLAKRGKLEAQHQLNIDGTRIHLVYFRSGYNLKDYNSGALIDFRAKLETLDLGVCPSIRHQLATSKVVQMALSELSLMEISQLFKLTIDEATLATNALSVNYHLANSKQEVRRYLDSGRWLLKSQAEGGGGVSNLSVFDEQDCEPQAGQFLMEIIQTVPANQSHAIFQAGDIRQISHLISEVGIFNVGDNQDYGGYLIRSKSQSSLETGVHRGDGILDILAIEP